MTKTQPISHSGRAIAIEAKVEDKEVDRCVEDPVEPSQGCSPQVDRLQNELAEDGLSRHKDVLWMVELLSPNILSAANAMKVPGADDMYRLGPFGRNEMHITRRILHDFPYTSVEGKAAHALLGSFIADQYVPNRAVPLIQRVRNLQKTITGESAGPVSGRTARTYEVLLSHIAAVLIEQPDATVRLTNDVELLREPQMSLHDLILPSSNAFSSCMEDDKKFKEKFIGRFEAALARRKEELDVERAFKAH
uniref:Uncharacterized protein n=1 Tax=Caenorhabditis japonica TaxID=281687 RepID=A0A8R1EH54_CAEJA